MHTSCFENHICLNMQFAKKYIHLGAQREKKMRIQKKDSVEKICRKNEAEIIEGNTAYTMSNCLFTFLFVLLIFFFSISIYAFLSF